jgi:hypothetical protein
VCIAETGLKEIAVAGSIENQLPAEAEAARELVR